MSSNPPPFLRRARKFPSASGIEPDSNAAATNARMSTHAPQVQNNGLPTSRNFKHLRSRSVSQANFGALSSHSHSHSESSSTASRYARKAASTAQLSQQQQPITIEGLISKPPASLTEALQDLRHLILTQGVAADADGNSALRIYIWSILLGVGPMRTNEYVALVRRGASSSYSKIRNDTFRTLATDPLFRRRVSESSIIRLLNAFQWKMKDTGVDAQDAQYVQGMNVIAAPFLYAARSEVEAFSLFSVFIQRECPGYVRPTMEGVHSGLKLVDQCLETVDPVLFKHLQSKFLTAELYAFPSVLTLSACTPPLPEVLKLWDFLLAYGAHLNILCVVAQLLLMRDDLLGAQSPMKLLRQFPPLNSKTIIDVAVGLVRRIPPELFDQLVEHAR
ncbi:rab-GTPase-TBC domain-containing protein [Tricharina praecox]|uniref:rab-GTPase-TBC domain-containing protein n=1 Tax=Tricharina praecox TaxID=43433 RepID=UPI0022201E5C|nr:rab-GTPase-TBC domain-containing protein [Tricharina praecox]KAI5846927.1 rab-GTPase-TBC domain-containing protein [Tricharina praecox]